MFTCSAGLPMSFSTGMDTLTDELNRRGVYATSHSHTDWKELADKAAADYKAGKEGPIILIGHSLGADAVMEMADYLGDRGVPVALVIPFDGTQSFPASANISRVVNFTQRDYAYMRKGARLSRHACQCGRELGSRYRSSQYRQVAAAACARDQRSLGRRGRTYGPAGRGQTGRHAAVAERHDWHRAPRGRRQKRRATQRRARYRARSAGRFGACENEPKLSRRRPNGRPAKTDESMKGARQ